MSILTNALHGSWLRGRETATLAASIAVLLAGHASLCAAQSSDLTRSHGSLSSSPESNSPADARAVRSGQPTYPSPEDAASALFQAAQSGRDQAVQKVLGADEQLVSSGDAATDKQDRERFVQKYQEMHRLARQPNGTTVLYIGAENWPFPVPLVSSHGAWRFDADDGATEVLFRRIGEDEFAAIQICQSLSEARRAHGTDQGSAQSGSLVNTLLSEPAGGHKAVPYQGYYFRVLSRSGDRFSAIAYPAAYRSSGVMTFVVNQSNVVYEKDLGPAGTRAVQTASTIRTDSTWKPVEEPASP
jgi:hypothetical protein